MMDDPATELADVLPDLLEPGLRIVFCYPCETERDNSGTLTSPKPKQCLLSAELSVIVLDTG
jgi:hypothetical protein